MEELKPCPFCGGEGVVKIEEFGAELMFLPHCGNLGYGCWAMQENWYDTLDEAIEAWNRRTEDGRT